MEHLYSTLCTGLFHQMTTMPALMISLFSMLLLVVPTTSAAPNGTKCPLAPGRPETCVCQPTNQNLVDMTPLSNTNGTARFTNLTDPNKKYNYSYNPCKPFTDGDCKNIHGCQTSIVDPKVKYSIADAGTEEMWIDFDGTPYLYYTGPGGRVLTVYLNCDVAAKTPIATTDGDNQTRLHYVINITYCQWCTPGGCQQPSPPVPPPPAAVPANSIPTLCPPIPGKPSCVCQHPNGVIDLTPYADDSGKAMFSVGTGNGSANYYYNPCQAFHMSKCLNTHICMMSSNSTLALANVGTEKIYSDSSTDKVYVQYTGPTEIPNRVYLECDHSIQRGSPSLSLRYNFASPSTVSLALKSCQVCPGGC